MQESEQFLQRINDLFLERTGTFLSPIQTILLMESLRNPQKTYDEIAVENSYSSSYIKHNIAPNLWNSLSQLLDIKINKTNCRIVAKAFLKNRDPAEILQQVQPNTKNPLEYPEGIVPLDSPFYIERPPLEAFCIQEILKPHSLIRIKGPRKMGKTSLLTRILFAAQQQNYQTVNISLNAADSQLLENSHTFLRWVCANIAIQLEINKKVNQYWDEELGAIVSASFYLQNCILKNVQTPLVLAFDEINQLFEFPTLARDFLALLRSWYEETRNIERWKKLRLLIVHSTDVYIPIEINHSPFNVGTAVEIKPFTIGQVNLLAQRHGIYLDAEKLQQLMEKIGGFPYLVRLLLYHSVYTDMDVESILKDSNYFTAIYQHHLQGQLWHLLKKPELATAYQQVVNSTKPVELNQVTAFKLNSLGLIQLTQSPNPYLPKNYAIPSCELYRQYFIQHL
ncbi:AAA-like domain-containing protein [Spirulina sp. CS-785/01]|uniref:AAA-like domain-containing protein n=1 Tax=Spirulina sp. CS-785/01 TaxID=3021716 RepID=UPI0023312211|nr:AAA-like domain-containing protein [Spirulina sp. CS-785/01]MDB9315043.1 AAA-like domain-containing protein [Spirulina sp. CS-785/01]